MPLHLTAVIITRNEAHNIGDCIAALRGWTDAVIVWDSCSQDETRQIAHEAGARVVVRPFDDYARQRQAALDSIDSEWVLFIDADERATPTLAQEVLKASRDASCAGYSIPRRNFIVGREMRGGGFTPDYQLRLLRRRCAPLRPEPRSPRSRPPRRRRGQAARTTAALQLRGLDPVSQQAAGVRPL